MYEQVLTIRISCQLIYPFWKNFKKLLLFVFNNDCTTRQSFLRNSNYFKFELKCHFSICWERVRKLLKNRVVYWSLSKARVFQQLVIGYVETILSILIGSVRGEEMNNKWNSISYKVSFESLPNIDTFQ